MSGAGDLDVREQIARIDRAMEETHKFTAETHKLTEEALKLRRDRWLAPLLVVVALIGGIGGTIAGITSILRLLGKAP